MFYLHICPLVRRGAPSHGSMLEVGCEISLVPLMFSSLKRMTCGTHTSGPSSTSEWSDMATRVALRHWLHIAGAQPLPRRRARTRRPRGSLTPRGAHASLGELERTLMSPRGGWIGVTTKLNSFSQNTWADSAPPVTGGCDRSNRSSTGPHRWHWSDRCASPVRPV
jgi:hypothetical protein